MVDAPLTLGVEEEYQIIDPETRGLTSYAQQMIHKGRVVLGDQVKQEFMQSQIEVGSDICENIAEVRQEIIRLRKSVSDLASEYGRVIAAASTHPFSFWEEQLISPQDRYRDLEFNMQELGRRMLIFGMHTHVGIGNSHDALDLIIDVQNQARYFLPHILALTTSSPFWHGRNTGLKSYRSVIFEDLPRTGIPPILSSFGEYQEMVAILDKIGSLGAKRYDGKADYTRIWWDTRPQEDFGTIEFRVADICTTVDETVCIVALIQAIVAKLIKLRNENQSWRIYRTELINENKWRAIRYGIHGDLVDFGKFESISFRILTEELLAFVDDVLDDLGSRSEVEYVYTILENGTSADRQVAVFQKALDEGATQDEALKQVVDQLVAETMRGVN